MSEPEFKETIGPKQAMLFHQEELAPIFCKPKLLPMKTVTMEKLEKMQREAEKLIIQQQQPQQEEGLQDTSAPTEEDPNAPKTTEVWSADD